MIADFFDHSAENIVKLLLQPDSVTNIILTPDHELKIETKTNSDIKTVVLDDAYEYKTFNPENNITYNLDLQTRISLRKFNLPRFLITGIHLICRIDELQITLKYVCLNMKNSKLERKKSVYYLNRV